MNLLNKKLALVTLIKHSMSFASEAKLALLEHVKSMTEEDVEKLGKYLLAEHTFVIENEDLILRCTKEVSETFDSSPNTRFDNTVYVGVGKP
jgi:hypothetical protein